MTELDPDVREIYWTMFSKYSLMHNDLPKRLKHCKETLKYMIINKEQVYW